MPTVPQVVDLKAQLRSYRGIVPDEYNPSDVPLATYQLMRRRDPIVRYAYWHVTRSVRRRIGDYTHADERVQDYVRRQVVPQLMKDLPRLQKAVYFGVALAQPRWVLDGGELKLRELVACPSSRFWNGRGFRRDDAGDVDAVDVQGVGYLTLLDERTGVRQLVHYHTGDDEGSPWGSPAARLAYTAWYIKHRLIPFEAIGLERHGVGTGVFYVSDDTPDENGVEPGEAYVQAWSQMGSASALALDKDDKLEVVSPGWLVNSPYDPVVRRLDGYIFNSFFMPYLIAAEAQFGTRAQADVQTETYLMAETDIAEETADVAREQVIDEAVRLQFGPGVEPGDLTVRDPAPPDLEAWSRILGILSSVGAFDAEVDEQLLWLGERFNLPVQSLLDAYRAGAAPGGAGTPAERAAVQA